MSDSYEWALTGKTAEHMLLANHKQIYATFVLSIVAEEDKSRPIWPSCPAFGWVSGVNRIDSLPNGTRFSQSEGFESY